MGSHGSHGHKQKKRLKYRGPGNNCGAQVKGKEGRNRKKK